MKIDPNTNLPELPEGYFWHVSDVYNAGSLGTWPAIHVMLWQNYEGFNLFRFKKVTKQRCIGGKYMHLSAIREQGEDPEEVVQYLAEKVYEYYGTWLPFPDPLYDDIKSLVGDYPPKKLGN